MHFVFNSKVVYKSEAYLSVRIRWKKINREYRRAETSLIHKKEVPWINVKWGKRAERILIKIGKKRRKKCYPLQKLIHVLKKNVVLACKRKRACTAINLKDAVIPLRMYWAHNPTGGDTQWSTLVLHKLCLSSLICLEIPIFASWQQTYTCVR